MKKFNLNKIVKLQQFFKSKIDTKIKLQHQVDFISNILDKIIIRIKCSYINNIITQNEYKHYMDLINTNFNKIPSNISICNINGQSRYSFMLNIAKIKLNIINIVLKIGSNNINDILILILNFNKSNVDYKYQKLLKFYNKIFNPTGCDIYESTNSENISYTLYNYGNKIIKNSNDLKLTTFQLDYPTCNKISIFTKPLILKLYGGKLYFPYKNKLLVIYGYFIKDDLNFARKEDFLKKKEVAINKKFEDVEIPMSFKNNFLKQISIKDFILLSNDKIYSSCVKAHKDLNKFKLKKISDLVKDFLISDIEKQRYYITILVLNTEDTESQYLAYLLYDLISSQKNLTNTTLLYSSLHWSVQQLFKNSQKNINKINEKLLNFNENSIPYEKRIYLMKASEYIKSKALDKLKEINSSKGGETNAKAQQYLDGLLKVPFGIYKIDSIKYKLKDTSNKMIEITNNIKNQICNFEEQFKLDDISLNIVCEIKILLENLTDKNENSLIYNKFIDKLILINVKIDTLKKNQDNSNIKSILLNNTIKELKDICNKFKLKKAGNKNEIITRITKYKQKSLKNKNFKNIININEFSIFNENIDKLIYIWKNYKIDQKKYIENIENNLNKNVYGLNNAKNQIKRIIGQWMSGNNLGYVFGFEGPPGTGKTTLAKKGIANCLKDINGVSRPFIFIALGGSSNGSTLEGHNYTYVGSTWGRIVDAIIGAKCMNPIIYIDELDKISKTEHGKEIVGILTHMTDPSQNEEFTDKYFSGVKFDISKCLIIFSYNDPNLIDKILLDRIHRIKINSLSKNEKIIIVKKHLLPEILKNVGYSENDILMDNKSIEYVIEQYTYEAGVRKLKEKLYEIVREVNLNYLSETITLPITIDINYIDKLFHEYPKTDIKKINDNDCVGLVNGLFATSAGIGGITIIEAFKNQSNNLLDLELTGRQGDVMKESMRVAKTLAWNIIPNNLKDKILQDKKFGIHIHCPSAATPKDGPSAGTAITLAIISLLTGITIKKEYALTGEIDLNGNVLKIGGLESKIDGAKSAGVKVVLCPGKNLDDLLKIRKRDYPPEDENFKVIIINTIYEAISHMLNNNGKKKIIFNNIQKNLQNK